MADLAALFGSNPDAWWMAAIGAMLIGMAKAGLAGCGLMSVVLFAKAFGAIESSGVVLPLLIAADFMGYWLLRKTGVNPDRDV